LGAYVIGLYGVARFFADIEAQARYDEDTFFGSILSKCAGPWFKEIMGIDAPSKFQDAQEFRQRHLIKALSRRSI
jgi:hypothetical protein